jgi:hypothetical protein
MRARVTGFAAARASADGGAVATQICTLSMRMAWDVRAGQAE